MKDDSFGFPVEQVFSELESAAVSMHELFTQLMAAGFTEDQALKYLAYVTHGGLDDTPSS